MEAISAVEQNLFSVGHALFPVIEYTFVPISDPHSSFAKDTAKGPDIGSPGYFRRTRFLLLKWYVALGRPYCKLSNEMLVKVSKYSP
jgi:hypothetical protein